MVVLLPATVVIEVFGFVHVGTVGGIATVTVEGGVVIIGVVCDG